MLIVFVQFDLGLRRDRLPFFTFGMQYEIEAGAEIVDLLVVQVIDHFQHGPGTGAGF